jgi:Pyruvate/2-oxoglutarate dehydrogenase complex, dihydrolipoamide dehydrogenase (E3) component, and related enzymes
MIARIIVRFSMSLRPSSPVSVFDRCHELVVFGGGYAGFGAALACATAGKKVLWIEPSGQLLRESTCGLENSVGCVAQEVSEEWIRWLGRLREKQAADEACFDPAFAEIEAARLCADPASGVGALFYAMPVAVEWRGEEVAAVTFATKAGYRTLAARRWIDASENGLLSVLARPSLRAARRAPAERRLAMALQAPSWEGLDEPLAVWCAKHGARARLAARHGAARRLDDGRRRRLGAGDGAMARAVARSVSLALAGDREPLRDGGGADLCGA